VSASRWKVHFCDRRRTEKQEPGPNNADQNNGRCNPRNDFLEYPPAGSSVAALVPADRVPVRAIGGEAPPVAMLDEGIYHCSWRSMYRILAEHGQVRERRR